MVSRTTLQMLLHSPQAVRGARTYTQAYFKRYIVRRQFLQHVISQPGHHSLSGVPSAWRAVLRLNTEDGVQYILSQFTLVGYVCIWVETKNLWSIIGWQTLWKKNPNSYWTRDQFLVPQSIFENILNRNNQDTVNSLYSLNKHSDRALVPLWSSISP